MSMSKIRIEIRLMCKDLYKNSCGVAYLYKNPNLKVRLMCKNPYQIHTKQHARIRDPCEVTPMAGNRGIPGIRTVRV